MALAMMPPEITCHGVKRVSLSGFILGGGGRWCQAKLGQGILYANLILPLWFLYGFYIIVYDSVSELKCNPPLQDY
jgi:hypothetical protein